MLQRRKMLALLGVLFVLTFACVPATPTEPMAEVIEKTVVEEVTETPLPTTEPTATPEPTETPEPLPTVAGAGGLESCGELPEEMAGICEKCRNCAEDFRECLTREEILAWNEFVANLPTPTPTRTPIPTWTPTPLPEEPGIPEGYELAFTLQPDLETAEGGGVTLKNCQGYWDGNAAQPCGLVPPKGTIGFTFASGDEVFGQRIYEGSVAELLSSYDLPPELRDHGGNYRGGYLSLTVFSALATVRGFEKPVLVSVRIEVKPATD